MKKSFYFLVITILYLTYYKYYIQLVPISRSRTNLIFNPFEHKLPKTRIHDKQGNLISSGYSFLTDIRFDRRVLYSNTIFPFILQLKETDHYEFFSDKYLVQISVQ
jgi:hypothetical protein